MSYAPTEVVYLEVRYFLQDFNLIMSDGSRKYFEFQSKNEGKEGLRRYRVYESITGHQYRVPVTAYELFSGQIHNPTTELREGKNTCRIVPITMKGKNADQVIDDIQRKSEAGYPLAEGNLVPLSLEEKREKGKEWVS